MLSVAEARAIVLRHARPLAAEKIALTPAVLGQMLAEDVVSDLDMPPYDKAMMDGYALRSADVPATLTVIEEVMAGQTPRQAVGPGQATRIMTGAPIPAGADAVVPVEQTRLVDAGRVEIAAGPVAARQHILDRGREMRRGEVVLTADTVIRPQTLGILATVGRTEASLRPRPRVAVLPTGDEIVAAGQSPGPGQIRNSNGPMIAGQVQRAGGLPIDLGIARDRVEHLSDLVAEGLRNPVLVLSGGVSAGKLDLVPGVLREQGVEVHFHQVKMKPGKPLLFGTKPTRGGAWADTLIFGLPGNPVSSLVCFELFVRPALRMLLGEPEVGATLPALPLAADFPYRTDRPTYYPARLEAGEGGWRLRPLPWFGSADLRAVAPADGFVLLPPGDAVHPAGGCFPFLQCEGT